MSGVACSVFDSTTPDPAPPAGVAGHNAAGATQSGGSNNGGKAGESGASGQSGGQAGGSAGATGGSSNGEGGSASGESGSGGMAGEGGSGGDGGSVQAGNSGEGGSSGQNGGGAGSGGSSSGAGGTAGSGQSGAGGQPALDCTGHSPPSGVAQQTSFSLNNNQLALASNSEWPKGATLDLTSWNPPPAGQLTTAGLNKPTLGFFAKTPGDTATIELTKGSYAAFRIETSGLLGLKGQLSSEQPPSNGAPLYLTLSTCKGDLMPEHPRCRSDVSGLASLGWTVGPGPESYCPLAADQVYYLNVFFLDPADPETSTCSGSTCWWLVTASCQTCSP